MPREWLHMVVALLLRIGTLLHSSVAPHLPVHLGAMSEANEFEVSVCKGSCCICNSVVLVQQELLRVSAGLPSFCGGKMLHMLAAALLSVCKRNCSHVCRRASMSMLHLSVVNGNQVCALGAMSEEILGQLAQK